MFQFEQRLLAFLPHLTYVAEPDDEAQGKGAASACRHTVFQPPVWLIESQDTGICA